ncbi:MAG TPA: ABC transporter substrate-binding protein [Chloroflexota bacterium]|jgi:4,5-dihydroxyphthalate decarboxylase
MKLPLTLACGVYDRTVPFLTGAVAPEGIALNYIQIEPQELFVRQGRHAEFDVAEFSLSTHVILSSRGDARFIGIPVFPTRKFRHGDIYVHVNAGIERPDDLRGKRVGTREYQQTAGIWIRGMLQHDYGVRPGEIEWYFGAFNEPGPFYERIPVGWPSDVRATVIPETTCLDEMLDRGELDAILGPTMPRSFARGAPTVRRLFADYPGIEVEYYRRTAILPIMHLVVIKREILERAPWTAVSLFKAFRKAKEVSDRRLSLSGTPFVTLPWLMLHLEERNRLFGGDPYVDGLEENRVALEAFVTYCQEQGLAKAPVQVDDLFAATTRDSTL